VDGYGAAVRLTFLGTSAGTPTLTRNVTAQALRFDDGRLWLLDCGEGTQQQAMRAGLRLARLERILVTHLHGDHSYGLPGMLACAAIHGRTEPIELVGPPGLARLIATILELTSANLPFAVPVREVERPGELLTHAGWSVSAWPLSHRVACFGYVLREDPRPGRLHPERAAAFGLAPGPAYQRLQRGESVTAPDGRAVLAAEVCDPPRPGRTIALLGDTSDPSALIAQAQGCDLIVHEATYDASRPDKALTWGHATSAMAGRAARACQARTLILTHFSSRYESDSSRVDVPSIADLVREAAAECPGTQVLAAHDLWSFDLPVH